MTNQPPPPTHQCDLKKPATCREESDTPQSYCTGVMIAFGDIDTDEHLNVDMNRI